MTHHTDAERAEFEAWARGYGTWEVKRDDDVALGTTGYTDITLTVAWHAVQAARRAPAAPVPQGWKLVPDDANMTDEQAEAICAVAKVCGGGAYDIYRAALAAAPQAVAVPEGCALVPIEPTQAMLCAGQKEWLESAGADPSFDMYRAMLSAAQKGGAC